MPPRAGERWFRMLLSLALPGLGLLRARRVRGAIWLGAGVGAAFVPLPLGPLLWAALAAGSAVDAVRLPRDRRSSVSLAYVRGRVDLVTSLDVARPREQLWSFVSDFERFGVVDPFHDTVVRNDDGSVVLDHNFFGVPIVRVGRMLHWHEGRGYAFSDLSRKRPTRGFPHVFFIEVEERGPGASRLSVRVRGKWTARLVPAPLVRAWLRFVAAEHGRLLAQALPEAA